MNELILLTQSQVATQLQVSSKTLEAMRQKGNGPVYRKFGRRVLYAQKDLEDFLAANAYRSTSEYK